MTYLMRRGKRFRVGTTADAEADPRHRRALRAMQERADAAWVVSVHDRAEACAARRSSRFVSAPHSAFLALASAEPDGSSAIKR